MTYTPPPEMPPAPAAQPAGKDNTQLFGWIGIVTALCCGPVGIIFGALSVWQAKKWNSSPVLGYVAIAVGIVTMIVGAIWNANRMS